MRAVSVVLALAVSLAMVGNLSAAEEKTCPQGKHPRHPMTERMFLPADAFPGEMLKGLNLTDDQKAKFDELKKEYGPKLKETWQKVDGILTADQKKAREEAVKAARTAGKRGEEVRTEVQTAMKLTDEQKAKMETARKDARALRKEVHDKVMAILTPEQREQLKKDREHHREQHKARGK